MLLATLSTKYIKIPLLIPFKIDTTSLLSPTFASPELGFLVI